MGSSHEDSVHFIFATVLTISFLIFIIIMTIISYFIGRRRLPGIIPDDHHAITDEDAKVDAEKGLNEATLKGFPKLVYSKAANSNKVGNGGSNYSGTTALMSCSVCLVDYDESDVLRMLPDCGHVFHLKCVDSWLRLHPTCPLCRKLPGASTGNPSSFTISV
ncbi:hypothetical protein TIFTF001_036886 [Ficus carica]|uniref:RING-type domain-containing protein n=1 Tax=Ficus carica TaxID=3494 RepID=A0AA88EEW4_FICCA|nr:hypothetical protein TIFTF001_036872 [Ficus carica]GMN67815.1 hypothetical protein TIFTF001_036876 [Ficus carica]GMN67824.1 hypothetical protein TIFTF001_036882 [Ficus carica]GMN67825.1 hypothetical protein TIFTF001_036886 [Ficus carica]